MDEQGLKVQIRENTLTGAYLFYGEEDFLKELYVSRVLKKCVNPGFEGFNLHKYDGESTTLDEFSEAAQMLPMMSDRVVVLVRDFDLSKLNASETEQFERFLSDIPETTVILFWMDAVKFNLKKDNKWQKIVSLFSKYGNEVAFEKKDKNYLAKFLIGTAQKRSKTLSTNDAYYLIEIAGDELNILQNEIDKLCAYCENGVIDRAAIDLVTTKTMSVKAFELTKAVSRNDLNRAFEILNLFFAQKMEATGILSEIITAYVDMYRAKVSVSSGQSSEALSSVFNYGKASFRLKNGASYASKLSVEQLRDCLEELDEADRTVKATAGDDRLALEQLLVRLAVISNR